MSLEFVRTLRTVCGGYGCGDDEMACEVHGMIQLGPERSRKRGWRVTSAAWSPARMETIVVVDESSGIFVKMWLRSKRLARVAAMP
jgi:hypothetical protein